jgi:hypothetical protein
MFHALVRQHELAMQQQELLFAQLTAAVINFGACRPKEPVKTEQFMPSQWGKVEKRPRMTAKRRREIADAFRRTMAQFPTE